MLAEAVRNNAAWCEAICRAHGIAGEFGVDAWTNPRRTPPYYPDAVSLRPNAAAAGILAAIDTGPRCSIKDSFADLDFTAAGFRVLFDAEWITCPSSPGNSQWTVTQELREWEIAWGGDGTLFLPDLLTQKGIAFLAAPDGTAGCIANLTDDVVGLSNLFGPDDVWPDAIAAVSNLFPGSPIVGYESGERLEGALRHGFSALGPLRVWLYSLPSTSPERTA